MAFDYWVDEDHNILTEHWVGTFKEDQIIDFHKDLNTQPVWKAGRSILINLSGITSIELSEEGVQNITTCYTDRQIKTDNGKIALVSENDMMYGFGRMFYSMMDKLDRKPRLRLFRDLEEAYSWLKSTKNKESSRNQTEKSQNI